jgi:hypothetical protein
LGGFTPPDLLVWEFGRNRASEERSAQQAELGSGIARQKQGERGELAFLSKAASLGFALLLSYRQGHRYDFVVGGGTNLWRVYVKTTEHMWMAFI